MDILSFGPDGWGDDLLWAAWLTIQLAVAAILTGFTLGAGLAALKLSSLPPLRWLAECYTLIIRGVPEFLILLIVFFGSENLINQGALLFGFGTGFEIPKFAAATAGLALIFAAYSCEVFRGAYLAVPNGQIEAAHAVGMSKFQTLTHIRIPQLLRFAIPGLGNLWMVILKDTSLAAVIALDELLRVSKVAGEATGSPLIFFVAAGLIYLALTTMSDQIRIRAERAAQKGVASS